MKEVGSMRKTCDYKEKPLNYRNFRGTKIIRVIECLEFIKSTLVEQLDFNKGIDNEIAIKYLEGNIKGLSNALETIKSEFQIAKI